MHGMYVKKKTQKVVSYRRIGIPYRSLRQWWSCPADIVSPLTEHSIPNDRRNQMQSHYCYNRLHARSVWCCQNLVNVPRGIWWFGTPGRITWRCAALSTWQEFSMCTPLQLGLGYHCDRAPPDFRKLRHADARSSGPLL